MKYKISYLLSTCCLALGLAGTVFAAEIQLQPVLDKSAKVPKAEFVQKSAPANDIYIVQMAGAPILAYEGDIGGYTATKPGKGRKVNPNSAHVKKYAAHLAAQQDQLIHSAGGSKVYNYRFAFNGFAARMSADDAEALRGSAGVLNVWKDEIRQLQTDGSPKYIGLTEGGQAWSKGWVGENVVIGVIDSGIWPEHPSFADVLTPKKGNKGPNIPYGPAPNFTPSGCDFGNTPANPEDMAFSCNNKLLAARCYNLGFSNAFDSENPCGGNGSRTGDFEFQSARDINGHGSHTAATAGGNNGVPAIIAGELQGNVSGIAPRARVAAYKVCWDGPNQMSIQDDGCASSDSMAAIDQAAADGVDVINYSIGGSATNFNGADDVAFLFAGASNVWVATSNGNSGPGAQTIGTPAGVPWLTSVGATQDNGVFYDAVTVNAPGSIAGDYVAIEGASPIQLADTGRITADVVPVVDGVAVTNDGCQSLMNSADVNGKIALAIRGGCPFVTKYNNAAAAGALAIIVFNDGATPARLDPFVMGAPGTSIPGVMIGHFDGLSLNGETGVNATLDATNFVPAKNRIAGFSSRGPNGGEPDIIKPDVSAPGVAILAAGAGTDTFMSINGTSMASPHVAGSFALLKQAHPGWTPAMARSALMTTARQDLKKTFGDVAADPFDIGAGEIRPSDAFDPGLAYDADIVDYVQYACGSEVQPQIFTAGTCNLFGSIDASDLNLPSIGVAELVGSQTVTRTVTSVANNMGKKSFTASVDAPPGVDVSVSPSTIKLGRGESASYEVTFTANGSAVLDEWTFGSLTWTHGGEYSARSPIAVRPMAFSTVAEVDGTADGSGDGSVAVPVAFGYDGVYTAAASGMLGSAATPISNITGPQGNLDIWCIDLPANTHFRLSMFDENSSDPGADDLDLRLFLAGTDCATFDIVAQLGSSGGVTSDEVIDVANGPAGGYIGVVDFFSAANGTDTDYVLWFQPVFGDEGNTTVAAPAAAVLGTTGDVIVEYNGLAPTRNLGVLIHSDGDGEIARTILDVDAR